MANALSRVGKAFTTGLERVALFIIAIPINIVTIPIGVALFGLGATIGFVEEDVGSDVRMQGIDTIAWGWDWWPAEVDVDWKN